MSSVLAVGRDLHTMNHKVWIGEFLYFKGVCRKKGQSVQKCSKKFAVWKVETLHFCTFCEDALIQSDWLWFTVCWVFTAKTYSNFLFRTSTWNTRCCSTLFFFLTEWMSDMKLKYRSMSPLTLSPIPSKVKGESASHETVSVSSSNKNNRGAVHKIGTTCAGLSRHYYSWQ